MVRMYEYLNIVCVFVFACACACAREQRKKYPVDKYTEKSKKIALFLLKAGSI